MKFGDKLIQLRKKKNLSQEELAEKLGVSRQSVSKWESNNTYPETDKIVQICNIFECSMDDLINDKVTDVEETLRKNKTNLNYVFDSLLEFISKTVSMFSKMTFASGLKCLIEMAVVGFILYILSNIATNCFAYVVSNVFTVFGAKVVDVISDVVSGIGLAICFVVSCIVLIHTFKIRYLNYFETTENIEKKKEAINNSDSENKNNKVEKLDEKKIIIRDEKDKPFAFLGVFSKVIIFFIKLVAGCIGLSVVGTFIGLVIACVVCMCFIPTHLMFLGGTLGLLASCVITGQIIMLIAYFILEKKPNVKLLVIVFLSALCMLGVGVGVSTVSLKNIKIIDEVDHSMYEKTKINFEYQDNLVINQYAGQELHFVVDDTLQGNKMYAEAEVAKNISTLEMSNIIRNDNIPTIHFYDNFNGNIPEVIKFFSNDLKKNQLHVNFSGARDVITIYGNSETINKIIENTKKLYLIEIIEEDGYKNLVIRDDRVYINSMIDINYNAITDTIEGDDDNICTREVKDTQYGQQTYINCEILEEEFIEE